MSYRSFDVRGHFLAKMVLLIFATRHDKVRQLAIAIPMSYLRLATKVIQILASGF